MPLRSLTFIPILFLSSCSGSGSYKGGGGGGGGGVRAC